MDRASREGAVKTKAQQEICPTQNRWLRRNPGGQLGYKIAVQIVVYLLTGRERAPSLKSDRSPVWRAPSSLIPAGSLVASFHVAWPLEGRTISAG